MNNSLINRTQVSPQAQRIIGKFGGAASMAEHIRNATGHKISTPTIYRWTYSKARGGTGGFIPNDWRASITDIADLIGIELTPEDWLHD
jgi:hypothetical protein